MVDPQELAFAQGAGPVEAGSVRGRLPALPLWQAQALCALFAAPQRWATREGWLRFGPASPIDGEVVTLEGDGSRVRLQLDSGLADDTGTGMHWSDYRGRSRVLAWSLAHEPQLVQLSQAIDIALIPVADEPAAASLQALQAQNQAELDGGLWLGFTIGEPRTPRARGNLRIPPSWVERLLFRAEPDPAPHPDGEGEGPRWNELPVALALRWDGPSLRFDQWRQLRPGDVLVIGNYQRPPPVRAYVPGFAWPVAPVAEGWQIAGPPLTLSTHQETSAMSENEPAPEAAEPTAPDVPVRLEFDLGRLEFKYEDLAGLQPGYVFALPSRLEGVNVTIRANGRDAARGEIVAVGETLGVRLISWS